MTGDTFFPENTQLSAIGEHAELGIRVGDDELTTGHYRHPR
jgi:hypothetical protein